MVSEYEKVREANIARNNAFLAEMGIPSKPKKEKKNPDKRKRQRREKGVEEEESLKPVRRSKRSKMPQSELVAGIEDDDEEEFREESEGEDDDRRSKVTAASLRDYIDTVNAKHGDLISDKAIVHVVTRLKSMSVKALSSRTKAIARAAGQHSKEKLLVTYYCMKVSGLAELAASCEEALARIGGDK